VALFGCPTAFCNFPRGKPPSQQDGARRPGSARMKRAKWEKFREEARMSTVVVESLGELHVRS
jgi:hypothetical protein